MADQNRLKEVEKYIEKYYIPGNDDIHLEDKEVKSFFERIASFREKRKSRKDALVQEKVRMTQKLSEDKGSDNIEFDIASAKKVKITQPLRETMSTNRKIEDLMSQMDETFSRRLLRMIKERGLTEAEAYKKAYVDRRHFSKIKKDEFYAPNKKTVLAFAIALELTLDETKDLLRSAGYALSRSSKFDIIVVYFLESKIYDMFEINDVLFAYDQPIFE